MTAGQRIADQLKAKASEKAAHARLLVGVQRYFGESATRLYHCEAIRDDLWSLGVRQVGECGGGHLLETLRQKHTR